VVAGSLKYCQAEKHQLMNYILSATSPSVDWLYHSQFAKKQTHQPSWVTLKQSYIGIGELGPLHIAKQLGEMLYSALCERERGSLWGSNVQVCRHYTMQFLRSIHLLMEWESEGMTFQCPFIHTKINLLHVAAFYPWGRCKWGQRTYIVDVVGEIQYIVSHCVDNSHIAHMQLHNLHHACKPRTVPSAVSVIYHYIIN
jgi:hypothetical protein